MMKEWKDNRKKKMMIVDKLSKLVPSMNLIANGDFNEENWRNFKDELKFTSASMVALLQEAHDDLLKSQMVKMEKIRMLLEYS